MTHDASETVEPTLAFVARLVTDTVGDHGRELMRPALLEMLGVQAPAGTDDARVPFAIARAAAHAAHAYGFTAPLMLAPSPDRGQDYTSEAEECGWWRQRMARRRISRSRAAARQVIEVAVAELSRLPGDETDVALAELLRLAVAATSDFVHRDRPDTAVASTDRVGMPCEAA